MASLYRRDQRTCSHECAWALKPRPDPVYYSAGKGEPREHVLVAEDALGRKMPEGWEVHHINEIKLDNRPQNLVICETRRLHGLMHALPDLIKRCEWLGAEGESVRLFKVFDPPGAYFCVKCQQSKPIGLFHRSKKYSSGVRSECADCRRGEWSRTRHQRLGRR